MKNLLLGMSLITLLTFTVFSCSKNASKNPASKGSTTADLSLSQYQVNKGQPLFASLPLGVTATYVKWSVNTNTPTHITPATGQAMILFSSAGNYRVTADYSTADSSYSDTATVVVTDTAYKPPFDSAALNMDTTSLAGDLITLTPSFDTTGNLLLIAQTRNTYGCTPYLVNLLYGSLSPGGPITINFYEVISNPAESCNGSYPAVAFLFTNTAVYADGTYPLKVNVGTTSYTGSLTIAGKSYSFTWNYTSGVIISPLQLDK